MIMQVSPVLLPFKSPLETAAFVRRYKRFFVDVLRITGEELTVHCANSGSMKSCLLENAPAFVQDSGNSARKLRYSLELLQLEDGLACLNTLRANQLVKAFLCRYLLEKNTEELNHPLFAGQDQFFKDFPNVSRVNSEVKFSQHTRFDFCLLQNILPNADVDADVDAPIQNKIWIEVKSVSLRLSSQVIAFPDAVTERGQRHLVDLAEASTARHASFSNAGREGLHNSDAHVPAFLFFVVMRGADLKAEEIAKQFRVAHEIDPLYAKLLNQALDA